MSLAKIIAAPLFHLTREQFLGMTAAERVEIISGCERIFALDEQLRDEARQARGRRPVVAKPERRP